MPITKHRGLLHVVMGLAVGVGVALSLPSASAQQQCTNPKETTVFGTWISPNYPINTGGAHFTEYSPGHVSTKPVVAMRLLLRVEGGTSTRWTLTIRDSQYRVLLSLGPSDFSVPEGGGRPQRWTGLLKKGSILFDLTANDGRDVELKVVAGLAYPVEAAGDRQFSIQGTKETWEPLYTSNNDIAKQVGDSVGMLAGGASIGAQKASWCCSGVMLSPTIFLTNWHCGGVREFQESEYWGGDVCANTLVDLNWDDGTVRRQFACKKVLLVNRALDFALLRLEPIVGAGHSSGQPRPADLFISQVPSDILKKDDGVFVVHHALCLEKRVSQKCYVKAPSRSPWRQPSGQTGEDAISTDPEPEFTHSCDTEPGASGAPIFDLDGKVVGLHHLGFEYDAQCKPDKDNKAVKIGEILKVIRREKPAIAREIEKD